MFSEKRWRYREDGTGIVWWWSFSDLTDADKRAVELWLRQRGIRVRNHLGNNQRLIVDGVTMWGSEFSHGGGPRSRWRRRIQVMNEQVNR